MPFSQGPRACLGRKSVLACGCYQACTDWWFRFFETEGIAILTLLILKYKITLAPQEEAEYAGLSVLEQRERLLKATNILTMM